MIIFLNGDSGKQEAIEEIKSSKGRKVVEIRDPKRSLDQNALWHKWVGIMAKEMGYTPADMKILIKRKVLGFRELKGLDGNITYADYETSKLKKDDFSDLMSHTLSLAADQGIVLPTPLDRRYASYKNY